MAEMRLDDAYAAHHDLLQKVEHTDDVAALVPAAESLIERVRRLGTSVAAPQTRDYLASMLNFWGSWLYSHTRTFPNTDLYPPDMPSSGTLRPLTLSYLTDSPLVAAAHTAAPEAEAAPIVTTAPATGTGVLMVGILQPEHGARIERGAFVTLLGMYTHMRPEYRLFFIRQGADESFVVLDAGSAPESANGTLRVQSAAFDQVGTFALGMAVAITPDAAQTLSAAHQDSRVLTDAPLGSLVFSQLSHIYIA